MNYRRTKLQPPYTPEGATNFPARNVAGVYLIYKETAGLLSTERELVYVGYSAKDVYKALYRHFQVWNDKQADRGERSERVTFSVRRNIKVRVVYCRTAAQAVELEKALIIKHRPKGNPDNLEFYELTEHGEALTKEPWTAEFIGNNEEAPF